MSSDEHQPSSTHDDVVGAAPEVQKRVKSSEIKMAPRIERLKTLLRRLWSHRNILIWALILAGYASFAALPMFAQRGYMDEKALIVGAMGLSIGEVSRSAVSIAQSISKRLPVDGLDILVASAAAASTNTLGNNLASPLTWHNTSLDHGCHAVHAVVPGGRGDGTESLLLALPIYYEDGNTASLAVAIGVMAANHLSSVTWLGKDLAVVFLDTSPRCSKTTTYTLEKWLERMDVAGADDRLSMHSVPPLGSLQQGIVLDIQTSAATEARIGVHGYNGQLPNLDMVVLTKRNIDYFANLPSGTGLDVGGAPATKNPKNELFMDKIRTVIAFAGYLAAGKPSGAHAALLKRGVDALTVTFTNKDLGQDGFTTKIATKKLMNEGEALLTARNALVTAEMIIRTCNNLHERLHHASALYLLVDADNFVNVGAYMAPPGLLLGALILQTISAYVAPAAGGSKNNSRGRTGRGGGGIKHGV